METEANKRSDSDTKTKSKADKESMKIRLDKELRQTPKRTVIVGLNPRRTGSPTLETRQTRHRGRTGNPRPTGKQTEN